MRLSMRWARRSRNAFVAREGYAIFGIVQGGVYPELRAESAAALRAIGLQPQNVRKVVEKLLAEPAAESA